MELYQIRIIQEDQNEYQGFINIHENSPLFYGMGRDLGGNQYIISGEFSMNQIHLNIQSETQIISTVAPASLEFPKESFACSYYFQNADQKISIELSNVREISSEIEQHQKKK